MKYNSDIYLLFVSLFVIAFLYATEAVILHRHFMTFGLDLGYFDEAIWKISRGIFPYSSAGCIWLLEDHFQPILYAVAPLYWLWNSAEVLLVFQSFCMIFAGLPLYALAKKITGHAGFSGSLVFAYVFFIGTQFAILNEYHQITLAPIGIVLVYYAIEKRSLRIYWISILFLLCIKEDIALLISAIGFGLLFKEKLRWKGLNTLVLGLLMFVTLLYLFMPWISVKHVYSHMDFGTSGKTPTDVILNSITHPYFFFRSMISPVVKLQTLIISLWTFTFLPLFAPLWVAVPLLEDVVTRFIYNGPQVTKWALVNHHAATGAMLLAICSAYGAKRIAERWSTRVYISASLLLIMGTISQDIYMKAPLHSLLKPAFYRTEEWMRDAQDIITQVPEGVSVSSQNNLLPHLTHRNSAYRIPYGMNSEYIVVSMHESPNAYAPLDRTSMKAIITDLIGTKRYSILSSEGEALLLKRNWKTDITKLPYYGDSRYCYYSYEEN